MQAETCEVSCNTDDESQEQKGSQATTVPAIDCMNALNSDQTEIIPQATISPPADVLDECTTSAAVMESELKPATPSEYQSRFEAQDTASHLRAVATDEASSVKVPRVQRSGNVRMLSPPPSQPITSVCSQRNVHQMEFTTELPQMGEMVWVIRDFESFRNAAKTSGLPPLKSPDMQLGLHMLLWPHWNKGHIRGELIFPDCLKHKDASYCASVTVEHPETHDKIRECKFTIEVRRGQHFPVRQTTFYVTKRDLMGRLSKAHQ
eukprot:Gregarina_sp_Poly_1__2732@NODE_1754_length_3404_cov_98_094996_g491_i1_p2_GENE_NODE_1754_length_3404_cov_98_094996_g491_i1NODE_1754_length_3404_cov_98_094996_g491_i1_p2_ORF_typecomplete_len263_score40_43_NODE_1754_length_3404_cov_98_094996_g491_i121272915